MTFSRSISECYMSIQTFWNENALSRSFSCAIFNKLCNPIYLNKNFILPQHIQLHTQFQFYEDETETSLTEWRTNVSSYTCFPLNIFRYNDLIFILLDRMEITSSKKALDYNIVSTCKYIVALLLTIMI